MTNRVMPRANSLAVAHQHNNSGLQRSTVKHCQPKVSIVTPVAHGTVRSRPDADTDTDADADRR